MTSKKPLEKSAELAAKFGVVSAILAETYQTPPWQHPQNPPVDELVCTILSQATSDGNRDKGFTALKQRYSSWDDVRTAPVDEIRDTIFSAGLANMKAPRIKNALAVVHERRGEISLDFLQQLPVKEASDWLTTLDGIGPKTAAIILLFTFNMPAFPVDTHVHRIAKRVGLVSPRTSAIKTQPVFEAYCSPETFYPLHMNLIQHGRAICKAQRPRCDECPLRAHCDYVQNSAE